MGEIIFGTIIISLLLSTISYWLVVGFIVWVIIGLLVIIEEIENKL